MIRLVQKNEQLTGKRIVAEMMTYYAERSVERFSHINRRRA
jgi:hypothetical protein